MVVVLSYGPLVGCCYFLQLLSGCLDGCSYFLQAVREYLHRARTVHAPCQVFEQLPQEMVYRERGCRWYLVGSEALPSPLVGSEWLLLFPGGPWMVTGIS